MPLCCLCCRHAATTHTRQRNRECAPLGAREPFGLRLSSCLPTSHTCPPPPHTHTHPPRREFWRGKLGSSRGSQSSQPRTSAAERRNGGGGAGGGGSGSGGQAQRRSTAVVNFKDLNLSVDDELSEDATAEAG
jgi:hypothetical protein